MWNGRLESPAAERNKDPILAVLRRVLPAAGSVLEIASGSGEHVVHFARALPRLTWQPSDPDPQARASVAAWSAAEKLANVRAPLELDVRARPWPLAACDAIVCINMIHISPWRATLGLLRNAETALRPGGLLFLYGPYRRRGRHTAPSNEAFDRDLRSRNPEWGVRNVEDVIAEAESRKIELVEIVEMPANNLSVVLRRM